jgi:hypothetical protein
VGDINIYGKPLTWGSAAGNDINGQVIKSAMYLVVVRIMDEETDTNTGDGIWWKIKL